MEGLHAFSGLIGKKARAQAKSSLIPAKVQELGSFINIIECIRFKEQCPAVSSTLAHKNCAQEQRPGRLSHASAQELCARAVPGRQQHVSAQNDLTQRGRVQLNAVARL